MKLPQLATPRYRWIALVFLALGLAIVIIDNTVLNVAIPYIIRDLHTTFDGMQWVVSGYALIIATLLITVGRLGDVWGRKKVFLLGTILFAIGSFTASVAPNIVVLFLGEALIEAIGASMMMTSSLSLLVTEFAGKERPIAFGIWGSVAGASATIGPLLGGYLTTYASWRWSLRINVIVAAVALLGSVFIQESKAQGKERFDLLGTVLSGIGLASLIFGFIEGQRYGWWQPESTFRIANFTWPFSHISIVPFVFDLAVVFLCLFVLQEKRVEEKGGEPLLRLSLFRQASFTLGLSTLGIVSLGQFGVFFIMPIFLQIVLGLTAFQTGLVFISSSLAVMVAGPSSGFIASRISPKWMISSGMFLVGIGTFFLRQSLAVGMSPWALTPALVVFGLGIGLASSQLTNVVLSGVPPMFSGEASAANATIRQVGTSIGTAIIGVILAATLTTNISQQIRQDKKIPHILKQKVVSASSSFTPESGQFSLPSSLPGSLAVSIKKDIQQALVDSSKDALLYAMIFIFAGAVFSLLIPRASSTETQATKEKSPQNKKKNTAVSSDKQTELRREGVIFDTEN